VDCLNANSTHHRTLATITMYNKKLSACAIVTAPVSRFRSPASRRSVRRREVLCTLSAWTIGWQSPSWFGSGLSRVPTTAADRLIFKPIFGIAFK
jgi:hypothetical protein